MPSVLIVDDLLSIHEMLEAVVQPIGYTTAFATDGEKALVAYKSGKFDVVLTDIDMKPMDGITMLRQLKAYDPSAVVIIMTAYASSDSASQALKFGAFDYLQKPFRVDDLITTLKRGVEYRKLISDNQAAAAPVSLAVNGDVDAQLVGGSIDHKRLVAQIKKLVAVRNPVLLQGETGTGKSSIAHILHANSSPVDAPFVIIDCAQSGEAGFHAGLIGEKGAGGTWVKEAGGGTLYLQNLDKLVPSLQPSLVTVLRGNAQSFRVICATCENLEALMEEGRFNEELFYRVATLPVQIPPLRERSEDIQFLIKHYLETTKNPNFDSKMIEFSPDALSVLIGYAWPGNVTELAQVIGQLVSSTDFRVIRGDQLPERLKSLSNWLQLPAYLALQEKHYIEKVLKACRGDKTRAASLLGIELSRVG